MERSEGAIERPQTGVDFGEASTVFGDPLSITIPDQDHAAEEERFITVGASEMAASVASMLTGTAVGTMSCCSMLRWRRLSDSKSVNDALRALLALATRASRKTE